MNILFFFFYSTVHPIVFKAEGTTRLRNERTNPSFQISVNAGAEEQEGKGRIAGEKVKSNLTTLSFDRKVFKTPEERAESVMMVSQSVDMTKILWDTKTGCE